MALTSVARDAFDAFHIGDGAACGRLLDQISSVKGAADVKVTHNKLLNDYYKSGCADPQQLLSQLAQAHDRARERDKKDKGRKKREEEDDDTYREDEDIGVLRYNQALLCMQLRQHAQATLILEELFENIEPIDDFLAIKICFLLLELCLLQRDPEQALAVLAYLEKPTAFLTVLRSERPVAKVVEPVVGDGTGAGNGEGSPEASTAAAGVEATKAGAEAGSGSRSPRAATESKEASAAGGDAPEGPLPSLTVGAFLPKHGRAPDTISRAEYRFLCQMYRARVSVALKNTKSAKKEADRAADLLEGELKEAPLLTPHPHTTGAPSKESSGSYVGNRASKVLRDSLHSQHSAMVNMLKAYLEYTRQNARKAIKLLTLCQFNFAESRADRRSREGSSKQKRKGAEEEDDAASEFHPAQDDACAPFFLNNLACIHFMMLKPSLAALYFQQALKKMVPSSAPMGDAGLALPGVLATRHWLDRRAEVVYNAGLQMLLVGQPGEALKCLRECTATLRAWPRFWMRMAECHIELHRQCLAGVEPREADRAFHSACPSSRSRPFGRSLSSSARHLVWSIQGGSAHRRWLLTTSRTLSSVGHGATTAADEEDVGSVASKDCKDSKATKAGSEGKAAKDPAGGASAAAGADGERRAADASEEALSQATMCLRNVLLLVGPRLPERESGTQHGGAEGSAEAGAAASGSAPGAAAASQDKASAMPAAAVGSAVARTAKGTSGAPVGGNKVPGPAASGGPRSQARDLLEGEASLLEDTALVKLAYVCLCQGDFSGAVRYTRRLLEKNGLVLQAASGGKSADESEEVRSWVFHTENLPAAGATAVQAAASSVAKYASSTGCITLAVNYAAEALLAQDRVAEARSLMGSFVHGNATASGCRLLSASNLEQHIVSEAASRPTDRGAAEASEEVLSICGGRHPSSSFGGFSAPWYIAQNLGSSGSQPSKDRSGGDAKGEAEREKAALVVYPPSEFGRLGETQCMLYTNLAAVHVQDGNLDLAEECCEKALKVEPAALAPLRTLVYILLRRGDGIQAMRRLQRRRL
mmetsp:Transcript_38620/g.111032  ORF Transcript_38620/g.111032 Transcript_38620/m.111032 type:complete len:1048 (-) Transcript_38620:174-3317(-)